jgi:serine/threonine protein kinase
MTLGAGTRLGPYEIGAGGMGEVYRARATRLGREVAIKVLPSVLTSSEHARQRFEREARTISQLSHPHRGLTYSLTRHHSSLHGSRDIWSEGFPPACTAKPSEKFTPNPFAGS